MLALSRNLAMPIAFATAIIAAPLSAQVSPPIPLNTLDQTRNANLPEAEVIMSFRVGDVAPTVQPLTLATFAGAQPGVGQFRYSSRNDSREVRGTLVFATLAEFLSWRETEMRNFFQSFGQNTEVLSLRVVRPEELARTGATDLSQIADDISIIYSNTGNDSEGDADIDAVTVICGDGADCEPSN